MFRWFRTISTASFAVQPQVYSVVLLAFMSLPALSQDGRLSVDMASATPRVRPNAPITLMLKTYWNGSSIIEGHFEVKYYAGGMSLHSESKSHDIVLSPGEQTIRLNLPTAGSAVSFGRDEIGLKFVTPDETIDLKRYPMNSGQAERVMNVCVIGPTDRGAQSDAEEDVIDSLRLGDVLAETVESGSISTVFTRWDNADVPEQPLSFCCFDMVLVRPEGLAELRTKQLRALLQWVRAGGGISVLLDKNLDGKHVEFLNALVAESAKTPFLLGTNGQFIADDSEAANGVWRSHVELGRAIVVDLEQLPTESETRLQQSLGHAAFLWKVRESWQRSIANMSRRRIDQVRQQAAVSRGRSSRQLDWQPVQSVGRFVTELMPEDVRVVPMSLIGLILLGYLILIGPIDYFLLGRWKIRRYTWLTFPLVTVLVSYLCVAVSESFLSSHTSGKQLIVRDIGADGLVLRESRFELKFLSRRIEVTTKVKNELFTPLNSNRLMLSTQYAYQSQYLGQQLTAGKNARYSGRIPGNYEVQQEIAQWQPQVNRSFAIAPERTAPNFAWSDTDLARPGNQDELSQAISAKWPDATAFLYQGNNRREVQGTGEVFRRERATGDYRYRAWQRQHINAGAFTDSLCRRPQAGFFAFVSQLSPNGGDNFEDLTLLDTSDNGQALLLVAVEEDEQLVLYRRLYTGLDTKKQGNN